MGIYVEIGAENGGKALVMFQYQNADELPQERKAKGFVVDEIPEMPKEERRKIPTLYFIPSTKEFLWLQESRPLTDREVLEQLEEQLIIEQDKNKTADHRYKELNPNTTQLNQLNQLKRAKTDQLNEACEAAILLGFTSSTTGYFYAFGTHDQMNFTQQMLSLLAVSAVEDVEWKTEDAGVIVHTREQFLAVCSEAEQHKLTLIERYRKLKADVANATTWQEVDAIVWD